MKNGLAKIGLIVSLSGVIGMASLTKGTFCSPEIYSKTYLEYVDTKGKHSYCEDELKLFEKRIDFPSTYTNEFKQAVLNEEIFLKNKIDSLDLRKNNLEPLVIEEKKKHRRYEIGALGFFFLTMFGAGMIGKGLST